MSYSTLMVHLELGRSNAGVLKLAGDLADRFDAGVIGIAAYQPIQMLYAEGYVSGQLMEDERTEIDREIAEAQALFRSALHGRARALEWRSAVILTPLRDYLASQARGADLLITNAASGDIFDASRAINTGELVMHVGRPVLVVPAAVDSLPLDQVLVAWKDSREARRAVADALPLLKRAAHVAVVELAPPDEMAEARAHVADVVGWLARHGVKAEGRAAPATDSDASALHAVAQDQGADLIVAGAYGHGRLREWVLGGVTKDLLLGTGRCTLISH